MKLRISILGTVLASVLWLEACTVPAWVNNVESDGETAAAIAESLTAVIDPPLASLVTLIGNGFIALVNTVNTFKKSPTATNLQAVQSAFEAVNANVAQLESAAQIKNATTQTTVTAVVGLLAQAVTEIAALVPANAGQGIRDTGHGAAIPNSRFQIPKGSDSQIAKQPGFHISKGDGSAIPNSGSRIPKGWKAKDFKREFNKIVKGDPRFKPLK